MRYAHVFMYIQVKEKQYNDENLLKILFKIISKNLICTVSSHY